MSAKIKRPETAAPDARPFISEGVRQDLEIHGTVIDPATGSVLELDRETGTVTVTPRI